jgi:hypothetical protein
MAKLSYLSPVYADIRRNNPAAILVESEYLEDGQTFTLETSVIPQNALVSKTDLSELSPETSSIYPFKVVVQKDDTGVTTIYTPNITTPVTASQNFYTRLKFERYVPAIIRAVDTEFAELETFEEVPDIDPPSLQ